MGGNYRMDDIQAAILSVKCKYISEWTEKRIGVAQKYDSFFKPKGYKVIEVLPESKCVYHLYTVEVDDRNNTVMKLKESGIACGIHYPITMNMQPACSYLGYKKGDFPVSENIASKILSLPIYPELSESDIGFITDCF